VAAAAFREDRRTAKPLLSLLGAPCLASTLTAVDDSRAAAMMARVAAACGWDFLDKPVLREPRNLAPPPVVYVGCQYRLA
jgi:hypothetical protein